MVREITILSILRIKDQYLFWLESPDSDIASIQVFSQTRDIAQDLANSIEQAAELLIYLRTRRQPLTSPTEFDPLQRLGWQLYNTLPSSIRDTLRNHSAPLIISTNDNDLPWELLHNGIQFLALSCPVGKRFVSKDPTRRDASQLAGQPWKALLIANPTGDLEGTGEEAMLLADLMEKQLGAIPPPHILCQERATRKTVLGELSSGEYNLIHYSGHAFFNEHDPGASGLILTGGQILTAREIQTTLRGSPLVFLNACESAKAQETNSNDESPLVFGGLNTNGLASAFIQGGAQAFIGSLWVTYDDNACKFARYFYQGALRGDSIGEALRWARETIRNEQPNDLVWASFVLYGDPRIRLGKIQNSSQRLASVLSAKLAGLSDMCDEIGPEAAFRITEECLEQLRRKVMDHHGQIVSLAYDTITAVFGASATREDHAELAIRAALEMKTTLLAQKDTKSSDTSSLHNNRSRLGLHIGLNSGDVLTREIGSVNKEEPTFVGLVFEHARTLQAQAGMGQILVGERIHKQTQSLFNFAPVLTIDDEPVYEALELKSKYERVLGFLRPRTKLFGRDQELATLRTCWQNCQAGCGQIVGIIGSAGIGKSRLLYEFAKQTGKRQPIWLLGACASYQQNIPFSLLLQILRDLLDIKPDDTDVVIAGKLQREIEGLETDGNVSREPFYALGEVLGIELAEREGITCIPEVRRRWLIRSLKGLLAQKTVDRPAVIVLEDTHWIDNASLEVISQCIEETTALPILWLALHRQEKVLGWEDKPYYHPIHLSTLTDTQSTNFLHDLLGVNILSREVIEPILAKAEGNPFFLEEIVTSLREAGVLKLANEELQIARPVTEAQVPESVQSVLLTRVDRLGSEAKKALQAAAVVGQDFQHCILAEVIGESSLDTSLIELQRQGLIKETSKALSPRQLWRYMFRHSLIQEAVYASLPTKQKQVYHYRTAQAMEHLTDEGIDKELYVHQKGGYVETLAYHYYHSVTESFKGSRKVVTNKSTQALAKAVEHLLKAGENARWRYANQEAVTFCQQAMSIITELPDDTTEWEARCHEILGDVYSLLGEFDLSINHLEQAFHLMAGKEERSSRAANSAEHIGRIYEQKGSSEDLGIALEWKGKGLALLPKDPTPEAARLHALGGITSFRQSDFDQAIQQLERALALAQATNARSELRLVHSMLSMVLHAKGKLDRAMEHCQLSIELDKELSDLVALAKDYSNQGAYAFEMDNWQLAQASYLEALNVLEQVGDKYQLAITSCNLADLYCHLGDLTLGFSHARHGMGLFEELKSYQGMIFAHTVLSTLYWRSKKWEQALAHLTKARELEDVHSITMFQPTVGRWLAQVHLASGNTDQAEAEIQALLSAEIDMLADDAEPIQHLRGQILAVRGNLAEAIQVLYASLARLEQEEMRYQTGCALLALAHVLAQMEGRAAEAQAHAERARSIFADLGAKLDVLAADRWLIEHRRGS